MSTVPLLSLSFSYWFLQTIAMVATAVFLPKLKITGPIGAFFMVVALALVNAKVWDAALFFHLPDTLSTHAGLLLITNGVIFWTLVKLIPGIEIESFLAAVAAPVVFTIFSLIIHHFGRDVDWLEVLNWLIAQLEVVRAYFQERMPESEASFFRHNSRIL